MTWPNCSLQNREGVTFCGRCGEKIAVSPARRNPRPFCGRCGSELRADGSCLRCSASRSAPPTAAIATMAPVALTLPNIPTRKALIALGGLCVLTLCFYSIRALWGDSLLIRANVPGAVVFVDGTEKGRMPADGFTPLSLGHLHGSLHTIVVKAEGYRDGTADVTFPNRLTTPLQVHLVPKPAGFHLQGLPGSSVFLNGRFAGQLDAGGAWNAANLQPADYTVAVRRQGYLEWTHTTTLKAGEQQSLSATQPEAPLSPEQKQAKAVALISSANQKFLAGQYDDALADCRAGLQESDVAGAQDLCDRIDRTRHIVNGGAK